jgi:tetratricopeptide (TPR) repeat protein
MKKAIPYRISLPLVGCSLVIIVMITLFLIRQDDPRLAKADESYRRGEAAKTIAERKHAFNEALQLYQELEMDYHPKFGTGKLYYNIGNTYFQLEEYPWAILNYLRAQMLMPRNEKVTSNLAIAQAKLSIEKTTSKSAFSNVFFFYSYLSLPERLQVFFCLCLLAFCFSSAAIWIANTWLRRIMWISLFFMGIVLLSIAYTQYFSPLNAVLVQSSDLYRDAGRQYAKVGETPVPAGIQVEVIDTLSNGKWLKIVTPTGDIGFIPNEVIRIL